MLTASSCRRGEEKVGGSAGVGWGLDLPDLFANLLWL